MASAYTAKVVAPPRGLTRGEVRAEIQSALDRIDAMMSTYKADSELSRLNRQPANVPLAVSSDLATVLAEAQRVGRLTDGAYDVTVGPLVNLWGFGPVRPPGTVPAAEEIARARADVGGDLFSVNLSPPTVTKRRGTVSIDLSSIAAGYAADCVADALERLNVADYMVDVSGEVRAAGRNAEGVAWQIGIETPLSGVQAIQRVVALHERALATSGDYRNYFERDGKRYCHILDPRTGYPIDHQLASVTVIAPRSMTADALATGLMVLGPEKAYALAVREHLAVLLIVREGDGFREEMTPAFRSAIR